jgi:hypothetical protein
MGGIEKCPEGMFPGCPVNSIPADAGMATGDDGKQRVNSM